MEPMPVRSCTRLSHCCDFFKFTCEREERDQLRPGQIMSLRKEFGLTYGERVQFRPVAN